MCIRDRYQRRVHGESRERMSKIRTFGIIGLSKLPSLYNPTSNYIRRFEQSKNLTELSEGINQRNAILPKTAYLKDNQKRVGFYQPNIKDSATQDNFWLNRRDDWMTRTVRIFMADTTAMHKVPVVHSGYRWAVQYERIGVYKQPNMGWTYTNDPMSRRVKYFQSLEQAITYCRELGLGYEVSYPRWRWRTTKNYADNFLWKGPPQEEVEDIF
eukprot:TRINITY_DN2404_c0_g1_i1.p2 TRINITY_DN2404_c0_g1~~TRINITY_DN2404_c0_g1_i1.p2  ORF type:complete len:213 (+),score=45.54 TRINITY_DN2404_c0_g1_i1:65-703(+)